VGTTLIKDEARARGELGRSALSMLLRIFREEVARFPGLMSIETTEDLALEFFADRGTSYVDAVLAAPDDDAAARKTRRWARHWLVDLARKLPYGALRSRIEKRLQRSNQFLPSNAAHHWRLADGDDADRAADFDTLFSAAAEAPVEVRVEVGGRVILGRAGQLEELLRRVLEVAGRLHISDLTYICARRFPSTLEVGDWLTSRDAAADIEEAEDTKEAEDTIFATATQLADGRVAQHIFEQLTPMERLSLAYAQDADALAAHLGVGRSTAYSRITQAKARLLELAGDSARSRQVLIDVVSLILDEVPAVPSV
jgi:hypothetical protein